MVLFFALCRAVFVYFFFLLRFFLFSFFFSGLVLRPFPLYVVVLFISDILMVPFSYSFRGFFVDLLPSFSSLWFCSFAAIGLLSLLCECMLLIPV